MNSDDNELATRGEIVLYQTDDGRTRVECRFADESIWLTQRLLAELFQVGVNSINHHIKEVFKDGELRPEATIRKYRIVQAEGEREIARQVEHHRQAECGALRLRGASPESTR